MASNSTTANTANGNRITGADGAANGATTNTGTGRPSGAAADVWDALTATPGATVGAIAETAEVSRATAARMLTTLEHQGRAVRTRGGRDGGKRLPDVWHPITPATDITATATTEPDAVTAPADTPATDPTDTPATDTPATDAEPQDAPPSAPVGNGGDGGTDGGDADGDASGLDPAAVAEARDALTVLGAAIADALTALEGGDGAAALAAVEAVYGGSGKTRRLVRAAANGRPRNASGDPRSQPGEMRAKVAAHLAAHPGAGFTPHEVAKVIGHSAGAVSNALDRLVDKGRAELVCERPRRFTTVPAAEGARPMADAAH
ncbi:MarR family transcriptional regulator [Actinomadura sp. 9N407]|uniref:MarR family transcriptional regulator n=1 Tax=Actinomadura sp. 9N407 TaxID=3375154 RepID=UPI0037A2546F